MRLLIFLSGCVLDEIRSDVVKIVEVKVLVILFFLRSLNFLWHQEFKKDKSLEANQVFVKLRLVAVFQKHGCAIMRLDTYQDDTRIDTAWNLKLIHALQF